MPKKKKKILLAEDDRSLSHAMQLKLASAGFEVTAVEDGRALLDAVKAVPSAGGFDLIVTDLIMPEMDGFSALEELKKQGNTVPIVVTSNLGQNEDIAKAKGLGATKYLVKSNTPIAEIVEQIKKILETNK